MDELRDRFHAGVRERHGRGLFVGLILVAIGGFWLLSSIGYVQEPARVVLPALVIAGGLASMFNRR
jgi:hypothetical protein